MNEGLEDLDLDIGKVIVDPAGVTPKTELEPEKPIESETPPAPEKKPVGRPKKKVEEPAPAPEQIGRAHV